MKKRFSSALESPPKGVSHDQPAFTSPAAGLKPAVAVRSTGIEVPATSTVRASAPPPVPTPMELQRVRIGYFQPDAREVFVLGSFNSWNPRATPLKRDSLGDWSTELSLPRGEYHYRLMVDGEWRDDPTAQQTAMNPYGGFDAILVV